MPEGQVAQSKVERLPYVDFLELVSEKFHATRKLLQQNGKLVGSYPITAGSESLPAPKGEWFIKGMAWMPTFRWDISMLQKGERSDDAYNLPPGPNSPWVSFGCS